MHCYSTSDFALLVALDLFLKARVREHDEGEPLWLTMGRRSRSRHLFELLEDRGWASVLGYHGPSITYRITRAGTNELEVFHQRTRAAAERAKEALGG